MKLDWGKLKSLPWREAWDCRRPLVICGLILWGAGLGIAGVADHHRAEHQAEILAVLLRAQSQTRSQLAQLQSERRPHHRVERLPEGVTIAEMGSFSRSRPTTIAEIAQNAPIAREELRDMLAQNDSAPPPPEPAPELKAATPQAESKPAAPSVEEPAAPAPAPTPEMPASLVLNPEGPETDALPEVPRTEDSLIGIPGESVNKPEEGSFAAKLAATTDPTDEIADPDERRIARMAFEQAGKDFAAGKWKEAKTGYEKVLSLMPNHPAALVNQGLVEERLGNDQAARVLLEEALRVQPDAQPALMSLGLLYSKSGELSKAMARLTRLIELNPRDAQAHNHLGVVLAQKGWREAAETEFRTAIEHNPLYQQAHFNLALMCLERTPPAVELARRHYNTAKQLGAKPDKEVEATLASTVTLLPGEQPPMAEAVKSMP